jgi:hypothetical protein
MACFYIYCLVRNTIHAKPQEIRHKDNPPKVPLLDGGSPCGNNNHMSSNYSKMDLDIQSGYIQPQILELELTPQIRMELIDC